MGLTDSSRVTPFVRPFVSFASSRQRRASKTMRVRRGRTEKRIEKLTSDISGEGRGKTLIASI